VTKRVLPLATGDAEGRRASELSVTGVTDIGPKPASCATPSGTTLRAIVHTRTRPTGRRCGSAASMRREATSSPSTKQPASVAACVRRRRQRDPLRTHARFASAGSALIRNANHPSGPRSRARPSARRCGLARVRCTTPRGTTMPWRGPSACAIAGVVTDVEQQLARGRRTVRPRERAVLWNSPQNTPTRDAV
jgi:hypothetical protein